jgi:hypothetical protein
MDERRLVCWSCPGRVELDGAGRGTAGGNGDSLSGMAALRQDEIGKQVRVEILTIDFYLACESVG